MVHISWPIRPSIRILHIPNQRFSNGGPRTPEGPQVVPERSASCAWKVCKWCLKGLQVVPERSASCAWKVCKLCLKGPQVVPERSASWAWKVRKLCLKGLQVEPERSASWAWKVRKFSRICSFIYFIFVLFLCKFFNIFLITHFYFYMEVKTQQKP
jgi:hypothetical protein